MPTKSDVTVVGSVNVDLVASVARLPMPGETVHGRDFVQFVGGKGGNQAVAAARLGRSVAFVGLVGDDSEGQAARESLVADGIDVSNLATTANAQTGRAIVLVADDAENSIVVVGGANSAFDSAHVAGAASAVSTSSVVVAQLEIPVETVLEAARLSRGTFILNPAPAQELPGELLSLVDVLVVNEVEYQVVLGSTLPEDLEDVAGHVTDLGLGCDVIVTLGSRGAVLCRRGETVMVPPPSVPVVDTTGAGDTFIGALADALARGVSAPDALTWAVYASSLSVGKLGATSGMPTRDEVAAAIAASKANDRGPTREEGAGPPR